MKNLYQMLRQKESELERVRSEVNALRAVVPLLAEKHDMADHSSASNKWPLKVDGPPPVAS